MIITKEVAEWAKQTYGAKIDYKEDLVPTPEIKKQIADIINVAGSAIFKLYAFDCNLTGFDLKLDGKKVISINDKQSKEIFKLLPENVVKCPARRSVFISCCLTN
jgi:hypothetical protein